MGRPAHDLTDHRFGRLTVVQRTTNSSCGNVRWHCRCDCGHYTDATSSNLISGNTESCGCLGREVRVTNGRAVGLVCGAVNGRANAKHGHASNGRRSRTYRSWDSMNDRCNNPKRKYYGARGIKVCDRWRHSFQNFLVDMGERPEGKTLDRYPDNNGNYEPDNCRWATASQQNSNRCSFGAMRDKF